MAVKKAKPLFGVVEIVTIALVVVGFIVVIGFVGTFLHGGLTDRSLMGISQGAPPSAPMPGYGYDSFAVAESGAKGNADERGSFSFGGGVSVASADRKVVKNASLELLVMRAEDAVEDIRIIALQFGGAVDNIQLSEVGPLPPLPYEYMRRPPAGGATRGSVTIRVPAAQFDAALRAVKAIAIDVESEATSARDVTEQFVDFEAHLKNLRAEEAQYQEIMDRSDTVEETLNVAARLYEVRGRIESIEAQLKYLSGEAEMSTITASLSDEADVEVLGIRWRPLSQAKASVHQLLRDLAYYADFLIALVIRLPIFLLWLATGGVVLWLAWRIFVGLRRFGRRIR